MNRNICPKGKNLNGSHAILKKKSLEELEEEQKRAKAREQMKSDIYLTIAFALMLLLTGAVVAVRVGFTQSF